MADKELLCDWIVGFLKNKDAVAKQITGIRKNAEGVDVVIEGSLKNQFVVVQPILSDISRLDSLKDKHAVLVTANKKENVEFLISNWQSLAKHPHLCIYFVNPNSSTDKKWVIFPATHDRITEHCALRKGLESMYATVEPWKE